ncbi:MAG TPA: right-handed parallel beta-helix repeat-containing protein [Ktedonobacteraceae bacterium]|nr:right-handed parallel beta-helix repeat-containing protein [Ktedonobacteraceae bacterium]
MSRYFRMRNVWFFVGPVAVVVLLFAGILAFRVPNGAHASPQPTLYVGSFIGDNSSCQSPGFTSVQTAVDAANPGATVYLCGTTPFIEQVIITKAITLTGDPGAGIQAPNPFPQTDPSRLPPQFSQDNLFVPQAIVFIWGSTANVNIKGLIISGPLGNGSCANNEFGVLVIDNGAATLSGDQVNNIEDMNPGLYGCQFGVGVQVGREYWPTSDFNGDVQENFVGTATISTTSISNYQKNGITVDGTGSKATITSSTITGFGPTPDIAQNGIQVSRGATGTVSKNTISGNSYTGQGGASSTGVLVYGGSCYEGTSTPLTTGVKVQNNTLQGNDLGIAFSNLNETNNQLGFCSLPITPTSDLATGNRISDDAVNNVSGYNLFGYPGGYQAGISEEGYADKMQKNQICGIGYTPVSPPPYLSQIDVAGTNPILSGNKTCHGTSQTDIGASTQYVKKGHIRNVTKPFK